MKTQMGSAPAASVAPQGNFNSVHLFAMVMRQRLQRLRKRHGRYANREILLRAGSSVQAAFRPATKSDAAKSNPKGADRAGIS